MPIEALTKAEVGEVSIWEFGNISILFHSKTKTTLYIFFVFAILLCNENYHNFKLTL